MRPTPPILDYLQKAFKEFEFLWKSLKASQIGDVGRIKVSNFFDLHYYDVSHFYIRFGELSNAFE